MDERTAYQAPVTTPPAPAAPRQKTTWVVAALIGALVGAFVTSVSPGTPANAAGLRPGDVITGVGGDRVTTSDELGSAIRKRKPGDAVEVRWQRGGAERSATVTLGSTPTR